MQRPTHVSSRRFVRPLAVVAAAITLGLSGVAAAQGPGPGMHGGPGMHHGGGGGDMLAGALQAVKTKLNLNTSQQTQWDAAVADSKAARETARAGHQRVHDALQAELAKTEPDFAAVAAIADQVAQANRAQHVTLRNEWLSLYSTFTVDQKAVVKEVVARRLARMDQFRARHAG